MTDGNLVVADGRPVAEDVGDLMDLLGEWINTNADSGHLQRVVVGEGEEGPYLQCFGLGDGDLINWGQAAFQPCVAPRGQVGFFAGYSFDDATIQLGANYKLGVLVIMAMTTFKDGSGRAPYMERLFFCREQLVASASAVSIEALEGRWSNTSDRPTWMAEFSILSAGDGWLFQGKAEGAMPWQGELALTTYVDNMDYLAFKGTAELGDRVLCLYGNTQKELIVLTAFHRMVNPNENRVYREFFYRKPT